MKIKKYHPATETVIVVREDELLSIINALHGRRSSLEQSAKNYPTTTRSNILATRKALSIAMNARDALNIERRKVARAAA